jgi:hypothetical protein
MSLAPAVALLLIVIPRQGPPGASPVPKARATFSGAASRPASDGRRATDSEAGRGGDWTIRIALENYKFQKAFDTNDSAAAGIRSFEISAPAPSVADGSEPAAPARIACGHWTSPRAFALPVLLDDRTMLLLARATVEDGPDLRFFGIANSEAKAPPKSSDGRRPPLRSVSEYAVTPDGHRLDAFFVRDAVPASEALPSGNGLSIAGAGDRPRRFMRGHRLEQGLGTVYAIRYADPSGGALKITIALPPDAKGEFAIPSKRVAAAITELSPDLAVGRVVERLAGSIVVRPEPGRSTLQLALDADLRRVGAREPQRLIVFGEFQCVPLALASLTPWLGKFTAGRPVLESFATPDPVAVDAGADHGGR